MGSSPNFLNGGEELGMPPGSMRRRGLFQGLLNAAAPAMSAPPSSSPAPSGGGGIRLMDRVQDDPATRQANLRAIDEGTQGLEDAIRPAPFRPQAPDEHMQDLQSRYQTEANYQPKPLSLKDKILLGVTAPFGSLGAFQGERDFQQQQHQKQADTLLGQIEKERQMQEQERGQDLRAQMAEQGATLRARMQERGLEAQGERLAEQIAAQGQRQQAGFQEAQSIESQRERARSAEEDKRLSTMVKIAGMKQDDKGGQDVVDPSGTLQRIKPGQQMPQGSVPFSAYTSMSKPTADEERRADLATNMTENLNQLEEILNRRPELFGPGAGRVTQLKQWLGTGDPDVAKLKAIKEYLGMASVGAHAMRNAQHVGTAADAVMAGFLNSPEATKAAIQTARQSVGTFQRDVQVPLRERIQEMGQPGPSGGNQQGGMTMQPPGPDKPGMKWQHRTMNGRTEWRQVPIQ